MGDGELQKKIDMYFGALGARMMDDIPINLNQVFDWLIALVAEMKRDLEAAIHKSLNNPTHEGCLLPIYAFKERWFGDGGAEDTP